MFQRYMKRGSVTTSPTEQQCQRFSLAEIKAATQNFKEGLVVGKGGFGKVYKGFIKNKEEVVAVKRLSSGSKQGEDEFRMEIETLSRLRHLHLVSLIGYCTEKNEKILVYEYMPGGTLVDHLYKTKAAAHTPLSWEKRLKICIGAARGLDYLHTGTAPGVIHRDVKDSNILLNEKLVAKIADFGLAKLENIDQLQSHVVSNVKGSFGYMDPEYVLTMRVSKKTDVYAFGVVLLVVLSGRPAVDMRLEEDQQSLVWFAKKCMEEGRVDQIIDPCLKLEIQSTSLEEFIKIIEKCLLKQPKERPSMAQVVANLELAWENQRGALGSISLEMDGTWTAQLVDPMSDERDIDGESDCSGTKTPTCMASRSPPKEILQQYVSGDADILELSRNICDTYQGDEAKPYNPQDVVYHEESSKISQSPSFEQSIRIFSFSELKVATNNFRDDLRIGEGCAGICYKGRLAGRLRDLKIMEYVTRMGFHFSRQNFDHDSLISVKRWKPGSLYSLADLQNELCMLKTFSHPNILNLIGYCYENEEFLFVHEFMKNGSLNKHLFRPRDSAVPLLSWRLRLKICSDVARVCAFMHSQERPVILRNMQLSKILLDESYNVKVSCFGLARFGPTGTESTHVTTRVMGTWGYAAPEYVATGHLSVKSDVFSFGVIMVEVLTGLRSTDSQRPTEQCNLIDWTKASLSSKGKLRRIMDHCLEGQYSMGAALQAAQLALKCLDAEQRMRPSMKEVLQILEQIQSTNEIT